MSHKPTPCTRSRLALAVAVVALATFAAPATIGAPAAGAAPRTSLVAIEQQVMCVTCGIPLQEADSPAAQQEKAFIERLVNQGRSASYIRSQLVAQYGVAVLDLPPDRGFNIAFYLIPLLVLLAALAVVAALVPRWRRNRRDHDDAGGAPTLSDEDSARLAADLAGFER